MLAGLTGRSEVSLSCRSFTGLAYNVGDRRLRG